MAAVQITLSTTAASLLTLIRAVESSIPSECRTLLLQADSSNGAIGSGNDVFVGDSALSATRLGYRLGPGDSREYESNGGALDPAVKIAPIYVMCSTGTLKLNVEVSL